MSKEFLVKVGDENEAQEVHLSITGCVRVIQQFPYSIEETILFDNGDEIKETKWYIRVFWRKDIGHGTIKQRIDLPMTDGIHELAVVSDGRKFNLIKTTNGVVKDGKKVLKSKFEKLNVHTLEDSFSVNKEYYS